MQRLLTTTAITFFATVGLHADVTVNVPIDHWSYRFIERCETKGLLNGVGDGIKPFSRAEMARALDAVRGAVAEGARLTAIERQELDLLIREFGRELGGRRQGQTRVVAGGHGSPSLLAAVRSTRAPLAYEFDGGRIEADFIVRQQMDLMAGRTRAQTERVYRHRLGGIARGQLADRVGFRIAFQQSLEQGSREYDLRDDVFERRLEIPQLKGGRADFHEGAAYVVLSLPFADVELGKDEVRWGPAPGDNLGLSNNAPSFDMLRLRARYGVFKLVSIAGVLRPCPDRPDSPVCAGVRDSTKTYVVNGITRPLDREKYLAAHRLEAALAPWIDIGFQEVLVYGDRGPVVTYLNPLMLYWAAQSYQGDKDNLMMGIDVDVHPGNGVRAYFAYVVDDLKKLRIFSSDFANKFSLQAGALWVDPLGVEDADLRFEYVRIEPWIYTHKFPVNTFRHFDAPLGHALGPNSDRWHLEMVRRLSRDLSAQLRVERGRHGSNELIDGGEIHNVGGDLHRGWRPGDERETKKFLDGNLHRWTELAAGVSYRFWPRLFATVGYGLEWGDNMPLPPRWGSGVALENRTGYGDGRQGHLTVDLRYGYF